MKALAFVCVLTALLPASVPAFADDPAASICAIRVNIAEIVHDWRRTIGSTDVLLGHRVVKTFRGPDYNRFRAYIGDRYPEQARKLARKLEEQGRCTYRDTWWVYIGDGAAVLAPYIGTFDVGDRQCWTDDTRCTATAHVVLKRLEGERYLIQETRADGSIAQESTLSESVDGLSASVFRQITDEPYWAHYDEDARGRIARAESVSFVRDWRTGVQSIQFRVTSGQGFDTVYYYRKYVVTAHKP